MNIFKLICAIHMNTFETNFFGLVDNFMSFSAMYASFLYCFYYLSYIPLKYRIPVKKLAHLLIYTGGTQRKWTISQMLLILDHGTWCHVKAETYV